LGAETIGALGGDVAVSPESVWCDVVAFEEALKRGELDAALDLYGGELLPGLAVSGARGWDTWLDGERSRLRRQAAEAAAAAYERAKGAGDVEAAWRHLSKALSIDPAADARIGQALR